MALNVHHLIMLLQERTMSMIHMSVNYIYMHLMDFILEF